MREINKIIIHCTKTLPDKDIGLHEITKWHRAKGYFGCGYHFIIRRDGTIEKARPIEQAGCHTTGHNQDSIAICLVGGINENGKLVDNFNTTQLTSLRNLIDRLTDTYHALEILGHNQLANTDCPSFSVKDWLKIH